MHEASTQTTRIYSHTPTEKAQIRRQTKLKHKNKIKTSTFVSFHKADVTFHKNLFMHARNATPSFLTFRRFPLFANQSNQTHTYT